MQRINFHCQLSQSTPKEHLWGAFCCYCPMLMLHPTSKSLCDLDRVPKATGGHCKGWSVLRQRMSSRDTSGASVRLITTHGEFILILYDRACPRTVRNFIELTKAGYYDGVIFHRVIPGFVAQTGDPYGDGMGGESIYGPYFDDEIVARLSHDRRGILSMANAGRNTQSSQFFIAFNDCPHLDGKHTVFGHVTEESLGPLDDIENAKTRNKKPVKEIKIFSAEILSNPWENEPMPKGTGIPEKPLVSKNQKCVIS